MPTSHALLSNRLINDSLSLLGRMMGSGVTISRGSNRDHFIGHCFNSTIKEPRIEVKT